LSVLNRYSASSVVGRGSGVACRSRNIRANPTSTTATNSASIADTWGGTSQVRSSRRRLAAQPRRTNRNRTFQGFKPWMPNMVLGMSGCSSTAISRMSPQSERNQSLRA
jgi:hypothetical protein